MKKKFFILVVTAIMLTVLPFAGYARDTDYTSGADFSWAPYSWSLGYYASYSDSSEVVAAFNNIKFNQNAVDQHNSAKYLTFEINNTSDNVGHSGWYSSNMPYAKYDRDDDNGNGYSEEIEVIKSCVCGKISAGTNYYFQTSWDGAKYKTGKFDFIIQRSIVNPFSGEFEGYDYDYLGSKNWDI